MVKDYAKKRRPRSRTKYYPDQQQSHAIWSWLLLLFGLVVGAVLAFFVYWQRHGLNFALSPPALPIIEKQLTVAEAKTNSEPAPKRQFDFYTVLPTTNFSEPALSNVAAAETKQKTAQSAENTKREAVPTDSFIIQVASFRTRYQAEELKAQLALSGKEASIQTFKMGAKDTWYRVYLGPYTNRIRADQAHQELKQIDKFHSLVIKINV